MTVSREVWLTVTGDQKDAIELQCNGIGFLFGQYKRLANEWR